MVSRRTPPRTGRITSTRKRAGPLAAAAEPGPGRSRRASFHITGHTSPAMAARPSPTARMRQTAILPRPRITARFGVLWGVADPDGSSDTIPNLRSSECGNTQPSATAGVVGHRTGRQRCAAPHEALPSPFACTMDYLGRAPYYEGIVKNSKFSNLDRQIPPKGLPSFPPALPLTAHSGMIER